MAIYVIGDVQGCFAALQQLVKDIDFDPSADTLWFTGDLVNRGPQSADVIRFVSGLDQRAISVLGNHDLHLLAVAAGKAKIRRHDTIADVLQSQDCDELLGWLRQRPLLHHNAKLGLTLIHAGLLPQWDLDMAMNLTREVESVLRGPDSDEFLAHMYGDQPRVWREDLTGWDRLRVIVNAFTRLRYCDRSGHMDLAPTGPPGSQPKHLVPWFQLPDRRTKDLTIIFGHWSTLGIWQQDGVIGLDTGCVWGGALTAVRVDDGRRDFFQTRYPQQQSPT
ncbi:MAG: symmetrical bis(5'-nucleosyl)-tetraphosphatase [Proteobacteria bacterium]|nr:MAG: symmetrical bis(5'-nucleosyl)-tetraphosphatase [Pseudomonadota bacterium]TDJ73834.1 MAG: symmetrical bis(5'-nucleosyl)-tetraphosphatase [Pseudomonadota bacterium]